MPTPSERKILNWFNSQRRGEPIVNFNTAKKLYIPKERIFMQKQWDIKVVERIFGAPSDLEKVEMKFISVEKGYISKQQKYECLLNIAYNIADICGRELDSNNIVWEKYSGLNQYIPISIPEFDAQEKVLKIYGLKFKTVEVEVHQLEVAINWILQNDIGFLDKKAYIEYLFELVYTSLKEIFEEVKQEIMGK